MERGRAGWRFPELFRKEKFLLLWRLHFPAEFILDFAAFFSFVSYSWVSMKHWPSVSGSQLGVINSILLDLESWFNILTFSKLLSKIPTKYLQNKSCKTPCFLAVHYLMTVSYWLSWVIFQHWATVVLCLMLTLSSVPCTLTAFYPVT